MDVKRSAWLKTLINESLQTLAAAAWYVVLALGIPVCFSFTIYLLLCTSYRWLTLLYVLWAWVIDKNRCERGGRRSEWVRSWIWWKYFCDYFPARLEKVPDAEFSKDKNYLFCSFPHGVIPIGPFCAFISNHLGYREHFPHHTPYPLTLTINFFTPFFRELAFAFGSASVSAKSITHILSKPDGGNIAIVSVGGASEAYNCKPGQYKLILKKRKGFVKLALQIGSPIVPVMSFGETDTFDQVDSPEGSKLRKFQEFVRKLTGIAPIIAKGRGPLGMMPRRKPVTILVGKPINITKVEDPTEEEINAVHEKFVNQLVDLFEQNKYRYIENAENTHLII